MSTNSALAKTALEFTQALVAGDFRRASAMLSIELRATLSTESLQQKYEEMMPPTQFGPPTKVFVRKTLDDQFPKKQAADIGWAYVAISGDSYSAGVCVVVANEAGYHVIREIQRPNPPARNQD